MKFNLPLWGVALLIIVAIAAGYFASMAMERMKVKKDSSEKEEKEVDLTAASNGAPEDTIPDLPLILPTSSVESGGFKDVTLIKKVV